MQRRDYMKLLGGVGLAGTLPGLGLSTAQAAEPFNGLALITVSAGGGWDQSSFADPRENPDINHWAETAPAGSAGGLRYAPMGENEAFFQRHHGRTLVINGIDLQTNGHSGAEQTQNSGSLSGVPGLNTLYAAIAGDGLPMPWLHHSGYAGAPLLTPQTSLPSLAQMLQLADSNRRDTDRLYFRRSDMELIDQARIARLQAQREAADLLPFTRRKLDELYFARTDRGLLDRIEAAAPESLDQLDLQGEDHNRISEVHRILIAIQAGICVSANLSAGVGYDSHNQHDANHERGTRHLTRLLDYLWTKAAAIGIADRLVVHVTSDVGRTPHYNGNDGKDHWSNGHAWIMMNGQPWTSRSAGLSGPAHEKLDIDPDTLQQLEGGERLRTAHVQRTLRRILGIDGHPLAQTYALDVPEIDLLNPAYSSPVQV